MKIGFVSLGCSKNQLDTEVMLHELMSAGYEITPEETEADIVIVNTCAFIESAKKESIDNIIDIGWLKEHNNLKGIIVTGCLAERYRDEIFTELPEVDAVLGVGSIHNIVTAVKNVEKGVKYSSYEKNDCVKLGGDRVLTTPEFAAYLKIGEGCDNRCTYCAIPLIRGKFRSRPMEDLVSEAKQLDELGVKELSIIAQDITRYGIDLYGSYKLAELIHRITEETNIPWIRLLYCYPDKITDELVAEIRDNDRVVKYIDLPLQHISDSVLKRMNRHGDGKMIRDVIAKLRREVPGIVIRTTFIVGFPGETDEDFTELSRFVDEVKFDRMGAFTYSREDGTPAYDFDDQIDEQTKRDRADILMKQQMAISEARNETLVGKTLKVLCEDFDPVSESYYGRSYMDAPDIDGKIFFSSAKKLKSGTFVNVHIDSAEDYDLVGHAIIE